MTKHAKNQQLIDFQQRIKELTDHPGLRVR